MSGCSWLLVCGALLAASVHAGEPARVGDPGSVPDPSRFDERFEEMAEWAKAGVEGGIPDVQKVVGKLAPGGDLQAAIDAAGTASGNLGVLQLEEGTYTFEQIRLKPGLIVRGVGAGKTILESTLTKEGEGHGVGAPHTVSMAAHSALEDLTLQNKHVAAEDEKAYLGKFDNHGKHFVGAIKVSKAPNCWIQRCHILHSGTNPLSISSPHCTFRDNVIDKAFNRGGKGNGYIEIGGGGDYLLFFNNTIKNIRHISIMWKAKYCVFYKNRLEIDMNYHDGVPLKNLLEANVFKIPGHHYWGPLGYGWEPWQDDGPGPRNFIFNNEFDSKRGSGMANKETKCDPNLVYVLRDTTPKYANMPEKNPMVLEFGPAPKGGTLYAVTGLGVPLDEWEAAKQKAKDEAYKKSAAYQAEQKRAADATAAKEQTDRLAEIIPVWDGKLKAVLDLAVGAGIHPKFHLDAMKADVEIKQVDGDKLLLASGGMEMNAPWNKLTPLDKARLAESLGAHDPAPLRIAAFFYYVAGQTAKAKALHANLADEDREALDALFK